MAITGPAAASARRSTRKWAQRGFVTTLGLLQVWRRPARSAVLAKRTDASVRRAGPRSWRRRGSCCWKTSSRQGVQALRQIIAPLDIGPPPVGSGGDHPPARLPATLHRVMQAEAFSVRIDEPGPPAPPRCRFGRREARGDQALRPARTRPHKTQSQIRPLGCRRGRRAPQAEPVPPPADAWVEGRP